MDINQIEPIARLVNEFSKLPSVGKKTAERYAYSIIKASDEQARDFADAILNIKAKPKVPIKEDTSCIKNIISNMHPYPLTIDIASI